jgi:hypothetical protein
MRKSLMISRVSPCCGQWRSAAVARNHRLESSQAFARIFDARRTAPAGRYDLQAMPKMGAGPKSPRRSAERRASQQDWGMVISRFQRRQINSPISESKLLFDASQGYDR